MIIRNVKIGDKFKFGRKITCEVVDILELKSLTKNKVVNYQCRVKGVDTLAKHSFDVSLSTVVRNRI